MNHALDPEEPPSGWYPFGFHGGSTIEVEYSDEVGSDGMPLWERPTHTIEERLGLPPIVRRPPASGS